MKKILASILLLSNLVAIFSTSVESLSDEIKKEANQISIDGTLPDDEGEIELASNIIPKPENINYYLFKKENPSEMIQLDHQNPKVSDKSATYIILIHGWLQNRTNEFYEGLKNVLLKQENHYAVIEVDWSKISRKRYKYAARNVMPTGTFVARFITKLMKNSDVALENFIVIGHSLGGQVAGFVGKEILNMEKRKLARIIALDPAGPLFILRSKSQRLNENDAEVVFVVHTNGGKYGFLDTCGTIDFFPNGGSHQPGCELINVEDIFCSHHKSYKYFIDAISHPDQYVAKQCRSYLEYIRGRCSKHANEVSMGDFKTSQRGTYYLKTNKIFKN